ncbi:MAG TPA: BsuPI-related putative proteinase inhibitor [Clostridia bacterium]|nr:BsuPI-related putative proteinase inhibitor [Clostridia bacterium]
MKKRAIKNIIIVGMLCVTVMVPAFAEVGSTGVTKNMEVVPINYVKPHWAEEYVQKVVDKYDVGSIFENKDLNAPINAKEFQNLISSTIDESYDNTLDSMTREETVNELVHIWADKTDNEVDKIPTIRMIVYIDMEEINPEYNHSITVAYMKGIAGGRGAGIFAPKSKVTYGEAAAMIIKLEAAIEKEMEAEKGEKIFETAGNYETKDGNMSFNFELKNNSAENKTLRFGSGKQFEITVENEEGEEVYRYSDGKYFTMAIVLREIEAGGSIKWEDSWDMRDKDGKELPEGKYTATIEILPILEEGQILDKESFIMILEFEI